MDIMDINKMIGDVNSQKAINEVDASIEEVPAGEIVQLISFLLDDVEYGVDILCVHEILKYPEVTRLPNTPPFIKGVINLRGNVISVVDMRVRFGMESAPVTDLSRIIVVETQGKMVGLLVDNVYQVIRIPKDNIDDPSDLITGVSEEFIAGIGRLGDRLVVLLSMTTDLFLEEDAGGLDLLKKIQESMVE